MEIFRFNFLPLNEILKKEWLKAHSHCAQCNSELQFKHEVVSVDTEYIREAANCPSCQIKVREDFFKLQ